MNHDDMSESTPPRRSRPHATTPVGSAQGAFEATAPRTIDTSAGGLRNGANRCPSCGGSDIGHQVGTDLLTCGHCRHAWQAERVEEAFGLGAGIGQLEGTVVASGARQIAAGAASLMTFHCTGCGAEVTINTDNALAARCHWCRHVFGINEQVANGAVPDAVLPFRVTREEAVAHIGAFVRKRRFFARKAFKREFTPGNVVGVFLPYLIVDAHASADLDGRGEVQTRRHTTGSGGNKKTLYDADVYAVQRHIDFTVDDLPLESSRQRGNLDTRTNTNHIINSILPFDTKNAVKWDASYLAGMSSEKRDLDIAQLRPRLEDQLLSIARAQVESSTGKYDRGVCWQHEDVRLHGTRWVSMLLPVWLYSWSQPGSNGDMLHYIAVNGRTGETMGSVPVQRWKLLLASLVVGALAEVPFLMLVQAWRR